MMLRTRLRTKIATFFAICAITSLTAADQPKFEAASVKQTDQCSMKNSVDPGLLTLNGDPQARVQYLVSRSEEGAPGKV